VAASAFESRPLRASASRSPRHSLHANHEWDSPGTALAVVAVRRQMWPSRSAASVQSPNGSPRWSIGAGCDSLHQHRWLQPLLSSGRFDVTATGAGKRPGGLETTTRPACRAMRSTMAQVIEVDSITTSSSGELLGEGPLVRGGGDPTPALSRLPVSRPGRSRRSACRRPGRTCASCHLPRSPDDGGEVGQHDTYGSVLAAQPDKSKGRPDNRSESSSMRATACPRLCSPRLLAGAGDATPRLRGRPFGAVGDVLARPGLGPARRRGVRPVPRASSVRDPTLV